MTHDEIRELIQLVKETGVAELEVQRGENRVRIRQSFFSQEPGVYLAGPGANAPAAASTPSAGTAPPRAETPAVQKTPDSLVYVKSPIVGTFYEAASPSNPPFVKPGDQVNLGKVLCIIESMKLMNEIETDVAGIVEAILVQNGQPVEYGEALFGIRPV